MKLDKLYIDNVLFELPKVINVNGDHSNQYYRARKGRENLGSTQFKVGINKIKVGINQIKV